MQNFIGLQSSHRQRDRFIVTFSPISTNQDSVTCERVVGELDPRIISCYSVRDLAASIDGGTAILNLLKMGGLSNEIVHPDFSKQDSLHNAVHNTGDNIVMHFVNLDSFV